MTKTHLLLVTGLLAAIPACDDKKTDPAAAAPSETAAAPTPSDSPAASATAAPAATGGSLKGICPDKIVIQTDWFATPERAMAYQLVGEGGTPDKKKGTYTGPLANTGVEVEVRLGGPFIGFQPVPQVMYQDPSIFLGYVATDDAIQAAEKFPTMAVFAPLDINPQIVMFDPATYKVSSWEDVAKTKAKISYVEGMPFMDFLVMKGFVTKDQKDASFDGTPSRFVAERGKLMQQAYASNEPYRWEHDVEAWKKPVKFLMVHESGFTIYPQGVAVKKAQLESSRACLKALVPIMQKAQIDYMTDPKSANAAILKVYKALGDGPPITEAGNANAVTVMKELKIVGNGPDETLGNFDVARVDSTIAALRPLFASRNTKVPEGLAAKDLVTNEFIDPSLHL